MLARDKYRGADNLVNAMCYDLTNGGELVKDKPHTWEALKSHIWSMTKLYDDTKHMKQGDVDKDVSLWLDVLQGKHNPVPRSLP